MILLTVSGKTDSYVQFITILILFVFVLGITYFVTRWIAKIQKDNIGVGNLEVVETCRITQNKFIQIVRTGEKYLVIAVGKDEIHMLAEVSKEELMLKESRDVVAESAQGYLGITPIDVTSEISEAYDMPLGIYISKIEENSPAQAAGLSKGNIITKFDGQTVKSKSDLVTLLTYYRAGETVDIIAMVQSANGYTEKTYTVTLGTKDTFGQSSDTLNDHSNNINPDNINPDEDSQYNNGYIDPFEFFWSMP